MWKSRKFLPPGPLPKEPSLSRCDKTGQREDAVKAMGITLTKEEAEEPEKAADHLAINTVRIGGKK